MVSRHWEVGEARDSTVFAFNSLLHLSPYILPLENGGSAAIPDGTGERTW